ncbi:MAG: hypothetical protein HYX94_08810 [Chloroflexi bacterium]|nr:hypothetical protein [Chloroflexota bacterium]
MNYGRLLRDAWIITWRHRFLWLLGLFAGSSAGTCSGSRFNFSFPGQFSAGRGSNGGRSEVPDFQPVTQWLTDNLPLLVTVVLVAAAVIILLWLIFKVVSLTAQGGMIRATTDLAAGRTSSLASATWAGLGYFWRFGGLWLLLVALTIAIALSVGGSVVVAVVLISLVNGTIRVLMTLLAIMLGAAVLLMLIAALILFNIVVAYAQRAMVVEDFGPIAAIRAGAALLRANLWPSLLLWLINVAAGIAAGLIVLAVFVATAVPLALFGILVGLAVGFGGPLIAYAGSALLVVMAVLWALSAVVNTYFWSYWTIAYLRLTGRQVAV